MPGRMRLNPAKERLEPIIRQRRPFVDILGIDKQSVRQTPSFIWSDHSSIQVK